MNIALVSHLYPNRSFPASGTFIREYLLEMRKRISVNMLVPAVRSIPFTSKWDYTHSPFLFLQEARRLRYLSIPNRRLPRFIQKRISYALVRELERCPADLVHVNWLFPDGLAIPALRKKGIPVVLTIHGSDWYKTRKPAGLANRLYHCLKSASLILTVGSRLRKDILQAHPDLEPFIQTAHNPVNFSRFYPPETREKALKKMNWDPGEKHILCVANLQPEKGVDLLAPMMKQVRASGVKLHLLGHVPPGPFAREVLSRLEKLPRFEHHAPLPHEEVASLFQACDLLVLPSRREGFGLALAEAIACGKPVVSTRSGGPEDIVTSENGYLVETEDPGALASKVDRILSGNFPVEAKRIRDTITGKFDSGNIANSMLALYEKLVSPAWPGFRSGPI